ncbi:hypothetical protein M199_gp254 [Halogranum tailed virus 1]|uniref:Uncharacterized protein n=1 Tax=Halogranum tailed virus 1 TaxID=1273749 RepID=R4TL72_9CAUD|nr:hypothetical protein M199_gp254 [Halogranum tailed virus 1]AGM11412.1 hypothetical protein HGTV1_114 [Halogranum tailed virus 1]
MSFDWEESNEKYTDYRSTNEQGMDSIYKINCAECGQDIHNIEFYPDADDPVWYYECHDCNLRHTVYPVKVKARASDMDV